jgi:hypothetical protein
MPLTIPQVAFHEAGHAIVAHLHGVQVHRATVAPMCGGKCGLVIVNTPADGLDPWTMILILIGGPLAESIHVHGHGRVDLRPDWSAMGNAADYVELRENACRLTLRSDIGRVLNQAADTVNRLFCRRPVWDAVEALAGALCRRTTLRRFEVESIIGGPIAAHAA